jgi:hypothetical protein
MEVERHNLIIDFFPDGKIEIVERNRRMAAAKVL